MSAKVTSSDKIEDLFPETSIRKIITPIERLMKVETTGGIVLIIMTVAALLWANLAPESYHHFWHMPFALTIGGWLGAADLHWLINDAMLTLMNTLSQAGYNLRSQPGQFTGIARNFANASEESITGLSAGINAQNYYLSYMPTLSANVAAILTTLTGGTAAVEGTAPVTPTDGELMMYAMCWSESGDRLVQVGVRPISLIDAMDENSIGRIIDGLLFSDGYTVIIANAETGVIEGSSKAEYHKMTLEEIGNKYGLTRERVRQIKEKAIRRLRGNTKNQLLKSYLGQ